MRRFNNDQNGLSSLIELVIALGILSILLGIMIPTFLGASDSVNKKIQSGNVSITPLSVSGVAGNQKVTVNWTPAANSNSASTYTAVATPGGNSCSTIDPSTTCVVTGLTNGQPYTFIVTATSSGATPSSSSSPSAAITPRTVPDPPTNVLANVNTGGRSINVSWTAPSNNGAVITGYTVQASSPALNQSCQTSSTAPATAATSCTVTGLTDGQNYTFSVAAINAAGTGAYSTSSNSITAGGPPTGMGLTCSSYSNQSIPCSITAPIYLGGSPTSSYIIQYSTSATFASGSTWSFTSIDPSSTSYTLTNSASTPINNGTTYYIEAEALNATTSSAWTSAVSVLPATVPGAPTNVKSTSNLNGYIPVSWSPPTSNGGDAVTGYTAKASPGGAACSGIATSTGCNISGLSNGTTYIISVTATNHAGIGPAATTSAVPSTVPSAPTVTKTNWYWNYYGYGDLAVIAWNAPYNGGSPITGYCVTINSGGCNTSWGYSCCSATIGGLWAANTWWTSYVWAQNASGNSVAGNASTLSPPYQLIEGQAVWLHNSYPDGDVPGLVSPGAYYDIFNFGGGFNGQMCGQNIASSLGYWCIGQGTQYVAVNTLFSMQSDGNLVLYWQFYNPNNNTVSYAASWSSGTSNYYGNNFVQYQSDGNLVEYLWNGYVYQGVGSPAGTGTLPWGVHCCYGN